MLSDITGVGFFDPCVVARLLDGDEDSILFLIPQPFVFFMLLRVGVPIT